ncbi:hypothetical protein OG596_27290 [Streptomyces sp. NBC_01102]|nr:hypothetical protein OG596_27290 [Streptomyces sp. NBC_01102]
MTTDETDVTRPGDRVAKTVGALLGCGFLPAGVFLLPTPTAGGRAR